jgi:hypothetical protein
MRLRPLAAALGAVALLAACKSPQEKLLERRREQRETLDRLYARLGSAGGAKKEEGGGSAGLVGRILGEADRTYFEQQCLALGRGERTLALSQQLDEFLQREDVQRECRRSVDLQLEIEELERVTAAR